MKRPADRCECCGQPLRDGEAKVCRDCELAVARMLREALEQERAGKEPAQAA